MSTTNIPIASLDPSHPPPPNQAIKGVVTLLWPYSSSTRTLAFLLSDPDFRLRSKRGQVRLRFSGAGAKAIAERRLAIGDVVEVRLEGARWEEDSERNRTPGRGVEGMLVFGGGSRLGIWRGGQGEMGRVDVDALPTPPGSRGQGQAQANGHTEIATPAPRPTNDLLRRSLDSSFVDGGWTYSSPAFVKRVRLSEEGSFLDSAFDHLVDAEVGSARKEKRTSFGRDLRWRWQERTPSPEKERLGEDLEDREEGRVGRLGSSSTAMEVDKTAEAGVQEGIEQSASIRTGERNLGNDSLDPRQTLTSPGAPVELPEVTSSPVSAPISPTPQMPPPPLLRLRMSSENRTEPEVVPEEPQQANEGPSTPKLQPVKSPTLPLPSPFPTNAPPSLSATGVAPPRPYTPNSLFGALGNAASVIERRRLSGRLSQSQSPATQPASLPPPRHAVVLPPPQVSAEETAEVIKPDVTSSKAEIVDLANEDDQVGNEDEEMVDQAMLLAETDMNVTLPTTIADDEMYNKYAQSLSANMAPQDAVIQERDEDMTADTSMDEEVLAEQQVADVDELETEDKVVEASTSWPDNAVVPQKSSEITAQQAANVFSLDGVSSPPPHPRLSSPRKRSPIAPAVNLQSANIGVPSLPSKKLPSGLFSLTSASKPVSAHVTPQAERGRVTESTRRNLFGLRSPQKDQTPAAKPVLERREERFIPGWFFEVEEQQEPQEKDVQMQDDAADEAQEQRDKDAVTVLSSREDGLLDAVIVGDAHHERFDDMHEDDNDLRQRDEQTVTHAIAEEGHGDVAMLGEADPPKDDGHTSPEPDLIATKPDRGRELEKPPQSSSVQVIELDASSDNEEGGEQDGVTLKAVKSELTSLPPTIQHSLEDPQDETSVFSEDGREPRRQRAVQKTNEEVQAETSPLSSPLPDQRLVVLAPAADMDTASGPDQAELDDQVTSSPTLKHYDRRIAEDLGEGHVARPSSTAATAVVELDSSSESEKFPRSAILRHHEIQDDDTQPESIDVEMTGDLQVQPRPSQEIPRSTAQGISYPTLPMSPSNSQALPEMPLQPAIEESVRIPLPPTPQLTQRESSLQSEQPASQQTPAPRLSRDASSHHAETKADELPVTPQTKTPSRRSARLRASIVPDVLSEWFSPRSSGVAPKVKELRQNDIVHEEPIGKVKGVKASAANDHAMSVGDAATTLPIAGFATAHAYFTPLSRLPGLLNPSSQNAYGTGTLDLLAVVTDSTKEPVRAKTGPRDYLTIFRITDTSLPTEDSIRVEVFRPYKNTLPVAQVGDVVLLRAFVVKSKKRTPYLLSTDSSAWCVWRHPDVREEAKPVWARKGKVGGVKEEMKGPPVEFGKEETEHAKRLRTWWETSRMEAGGMKEGGVSSKVAREVPAKL